MGGLKRGAKAASSAASHAPSKAASTAGGAKKRKQQHGDQPAFDKSKSGYGLCAVCSASSQAVEWAAERMEGGCSVPLGNLCKSCFEVYNLMKGRAGCQDIDAFVGKASSDKKFRDEINKTKDVRAGKASRECNLEECHEQLSMVYEISSPKYYVLNERELQREMGVPRLAKYMTKDLLQLRVQKSDDPSSLETVFCFRHPDAGYREMQVKQVLQTTRRKCLLAAESHLYEGQGDQVLVQNMSATIDKAPTDQAYERNISQNMMSLATFLDKFHKQTSNKHKQQADPDSVPLDGDGEDDDGDEALAVRGPAAELFADAASACRSSPAPKRPPVPLFADGAGNSLDGVCLGSESGRLLASPSAKAASVVSGGDDDENEEDEQETEVVPRREPGESLIDYWRRRLPLLWMFVGKPKGRTLRAMSELAGNLALQEGGIDDANLLRKYEGQCKLAACMRPKKFASLGLDDIRATIRMLIDEGCPLPATLVSSVVERSATALVKDGRYLEFLQALDPFAPSAPLNPALPKASAIDDEAMKIQLFNRMLFSRTAVQFIMEGQSKRDSLEKLSTIAIVELSYIDVVDLSDSLAGVLSNALTIFQAIMCCLDKSLKPDFLEALVEMQAISSKPGPRNALHSICAALEANPFYMQRLSMILGARSDIILHGPKLEEFDEVLSKGLSADIADMPMLQDMVKLLMTTERSLPKELVAGFRQKLKGKLSVFWGELCGSLGGKVPSAVLAEAHKTYLLADECFEGVDAIASIMHEINTRLATTDSKERLVELEAALKSVPVPSDKLTFEEQEKFLAKCAQAVEAAHGLDAKDILNEHGGAIISQFMSFFLAALCDATGAFADKQFFSLWASFLAAAPDALGQAIYELCMCVGVFRERMMALIAQHTVWTEATDPQSYDFAGLISFRGLRLRVQSKYDAVKELIADKETFEWQKKLMGLVQRFLAEAASAVAEASKFELNVKQAEFEALYDSLKLVSGGKVDGGSWLDGIGKEATMAKLQASANENFEKLCAKDLREKATQMMHAVATYKEALMVSGCVAMPTKVVTAPQLQIDIASLTLAMQLMYYLDKAADGEKRKLFQAEVLTLRSFGAKEKDVLPTQLFKASLAVLRPKAQ